MNRVDVNIATSLPHRRDRTWTKTRPIDCYRNKSPLVVNEGATTFEQGIRQVHGADPVCADYEKLLEDPKGVRLAALIAFGYGGALILHLPWRSPHVKVLADSIPCRRAIPPSLRRCRV
jgi:hypothetical protein